MNKLMLFPLAFLVMLIVYAATYTGSTFASDSTEDYSTIDGITIDNSSESIEVENAGSYEFNIWDTTGVLLILTVAISVGIVSGITALGSGLSEQAQRLIFGSILFGGLWACLSIVASDFLFLSQIALLFWMILTIMYVIGMGSHLTQADG